MTVNEGVPLIFLIEIVRILKSIFEIYIQSILAIKIFSVGLTYIVGYLPMALYYCVTSFRFLTLEYVEDRNNASQHDDPDEDFVTISSELDFAVATASFFMRRIAELVHPEKVDFRFVTTC